MWSLQCKVYLTGNHQADEYTIIGRNQNDSLTRTAEYRKGSSTCESQWNQSTSGVKYLECME